jgi:hypothetical protein
MSNNNILALVKQHTQRYIDQYNELKERFDSLTLRHDELKSAYQDLEREHNVLVKEKEETVTELNKYFNVNQPSEESKKEEPNDEKISELDTTPLFKFTPSPQLVNSIKNSPTFQRKHRMFNKRPHLRRYKMKNDDSDSEEMKSYSTPKLTSSNENTEVLKKILTDDLNMPTRNLRDASFSFNNMKPYIFTLDKNNKKN